MNTSAIAGNHGEGVRSDCRVTIELTASGNHQVDLESKVDTMYGSQIREKVSEILDFFHLKHAKVKVEDSGALDYVLAARLEAAIKQVKETEDSYLIPMPEEFKYGSSRERFRFSRLYIPGNNPAMMINAGVHHPEGIILDLEDSVAPEKKFDARFLVRNAFRAIDFGGAERMVRINQIPTGLDDLYFLVGNNVHMILIPKVETAEQVKILERKLYEIKGGCETCMFMPIIESALGVENAFDIARSSDRIVSMAIGLEDLTADMGVQRTVEGTETLYARQRIVNACKAAKIQPIDSVFSDVDDMEGLKQTVLRSRAMGFEGMGCIHPRQVPVVQEAFKPTGEELEKAKKIVTAFSKAQEEGLGVVALGSKMIDPPVVKRAQKTVDLAIKQGILDKDWLKDERG